MADNSWNAEDFSALWGEKENSVFEPSPAQADVPDRGIGAWSSPDRSEDRTHLTLVDQEVRDGVARLTQSIAVNQVDVVRQRDLEPMRTELEGTLTHQLAVVLYEVLAESNDRLTAAQDHMTQVVTDAIEANNARLVTSMESAEAMRSELSEMRIRLNGPIDALGSFQRDVRHEVGRLGDLLASERSDEGAEEEAVDTGGVSETLVAVKDELSALREDLAEVRQALGNNGRRPRKSHWWQRSG